MNKPRKKAVYSFLLLVLYGIVGMCCMLYLGTNLLTRTTALEGSNRFFESLTFCMGEQRREFDQKICSDVEPSASTNFFSKVGKEAANLWNGLFQGSGNSGMKSTGRPLCDCAFVSWPFMQQSSRYFRLPDTTWRVLTRLLHQPQRRLNQYLRHIGPPRSRSAPFREI